MIITGAPVEKMNFDEVNYWKELSQIMEWSKTHITSTLHICWAAQAGLYYHYGVKKVQLEKKLSGIYRHHVMNKKNLWYVDLMTFLWHRIHAIRRPAGRIF